MRVSFDDKVTFSDPDTSTHPPTVIGAEEALEEVEGGATAMDKVEEESATSDPPIRRGGREGEGVVEVTTREEEEERVRLLRTVSEEETWTELEEETARLELTTTGTIETLTVAMRQIV